MLTSPKTSRRALGPLEYNQYVLCDAVYGVLLEALLSATLEHSSHSTTSAEDVGLATATILSCPVPIAVASGVVFLSGKTFAAFSCPPYPKLIFLCGGLSDRDSVRSLNAVNVIANEVSANSPLSRLPHLTFLLCRSG
ncbi:uncharacterized protein HD556DRAFT_1044389 [Suillus plorans]|uniref:Uncharacterized protein n=1 Tax=Suillus plorans TaxID=116603 RepID=A0A9P7ACG3_9AGAM|nr:uncharacterized protein HD556DRAFT_1044389 [Suillus plorans]KAG1786614.1 hypothetical protein HD556DRAFT_1044389 [Suillus plorans]